MPTTQGGAQWYAATVRHVLRQSGGYLAWAEASLDGVLWVPPGPTAVREPRLDAKVAPTSENIAGTENQVHERNKNMPAITAPQCGMSRTSA